jgi:hypothetical protein
MQAESLPHIAGENEPTMRQAFSLLELVVNSPRALPWASMLLPLQGGILSQMRVYFWLISLREEM